MKLRWYTGLVQSPKVSMKWAFQRVQEKLAYIKYFSEQLNRCGDQVTLGGAHKPLA